MIAQIPLKRDEAEKAARKDAASISDPGLAELSRGSLRGEDAVGGFFGPSQPRVSGRSSLGLTPQQTWVIGPGFSREELKDQWLASGRGFVAQAMVSAPDLSIQLLNQIRKAENRPRIAKTQLLRPSSRQAIVERLLTEPRLREHVPELRRLKRQVGAVKRIDKALQNGRMAFAHDAEREVLEERLHERGNANPLWLELRKFTAVYEAFLEEKDLWDEPRLLEHSGQALRSGSVQPPRKLIYLRVSRLQARETDWVEALKEAGAEVEIQGPEAEDVHPQVAWERWHTWDDACEHLAETIDPEQDAVLMADAPEVRRSLMRALQDRAIPLEDPRDPTVLRTSEWLKRALRPLHLAARGFDRSEVMEWCLQPAETGLREDRAKAVDRMETYGFKRGIPELKRLGLEKLVEEFTRLEEKFRGRTTVAELGRRHLEWLKEQNAAELNPWIPFFEKQWAEFFEDIRRTDRDRQAPLLHWVSRFEERLEEAKPPPLALKARQGLRLFRFSMAPVPGDARPIRRLWVIGLPSRWLDEEGEGDLWFGERERMLLGGEFGVRSGMWRAEERAGILRAWVSRATDIHWMDAAYDYDGKEREGVRPVLMSLLKPETLPAHATDRGGHPRFLPSFGALGWLPKLDFELAELPEGGEVSATTIDAFSRCEFLGTANGRWKLQDLREADVEMWGSAFGNILHEAVKRMVEGEELDAALEAAWRVKPPQGLIRSPRLESMAKAKMRKVLESFAETEKQFKERAGTQTLALEGPMLQWRAGGMTVRGTPDRVESHPEGTFLIDYKTATQNFGAREMVEQGYGLQLPIYALALRHQFEREVIGAQFVELSKKVTRSRGLLFEQFNGKDPGKLHLSRAKNSLRPEDPGEIWAGMEEVVNETVGRYRRGRVQVRAKRPEKDCLKCPQKDTCGRRRVVAAGLALEAVEGEGA